MQWRVRLIGANETAARLSLTVLAETGPVKVEGTITGPYCPYAKTLVSDHDWKPLARSAVAKSQFHTFLCDIPDPCLWEPVHPFLYRGNWKFAEPGSVDHSLSLGCRVLMASGDQLTLNAEPYFLRGLMSFDVSEERLRNLVAWNCNCILPVGESDVTAADTFGPFVVCELPNDVDAAMNHIAATGPLRPAHGIWWTSADWDKQAFQRVLALDRTVLIAQRVVAKQPLPDCHADLLLIEGRRDEILAAASNPAACWIAFEKRGSIANPLTQEQWESLVEDMDKSYGRAKGCLGWIVE